jgi:hypothetical protein
MPGMGGTGSLHAITASSSAPCSAASSAAHLNADRLGPEPSTPTTTLVHLAITTSSSDLAAAHGTGSVWRPCRESTAHPGARSSVNRLTDTPVKTAAASGDWSHAPPSTPPERAAVEATLARWPFLTPRWDPFLH